MIVAEQVLSHADTGKEVATVLTQHASQQLLMAVLAKKHEPVKHTMYLELESEHPYRDNTDQWFTAHIPGAKRLELVFDRQSATERNCDYLEVFLGIGERSQKASEWTHAVRWTGSGASCRGPFVKLFVVISCSLLESR